MTLGENVYHGGLLRFDMSPKPAYFKMKELLTEKWHTEASLVTNENGEADFRGFFGNYKIEFEQNGKIITKELNFSKKCNSEFTFFI